MSNRRPTAQATQARPLPPDRRQGKAYFARAVGSFVPKVAAAVFEKYGFHSAEIMTSWETIVGADLGRLTRPQAIKWPRSSKTRGDAAEESERSAGATLIVATDPAFALDVSYRTHEIVDRINRYFGYRAIATIKLLQVPRTAATLELEAASRTAHSRPVSPIPTATGDLTAALDALRLSVIGSRSAAEAPD